MYLLETFKSEPWFNEVLVWLMDDLEIKDKAHGGSVKVIFGHKGP